MITSKVKQLVRSLSWQGRHLRTSVSIKKQWYGSEYGGFYVCPEFIDHNSIVYSFGVGEDISFDKTIIENHDCFVFAFDPTPKSINWVKQQQISLPLKFNFFEYGIGVKSEWAQYYLPNNPEHVSGSLFFAK